MSKYVILKNHSIREFINEVKTKIGLGYRKLSRLLGLSEKMVLNYSKRKCKLRYGYFKKLCKLAKIPKNKYPFTILKINDNMIENLSLPTKTNKNLAEFVGVMLGDGNLCKPNNPKNYYFLRICNHISDDKEHRKYIQKLFYSLFKINLRTYNHNSKNATVLDCSNRLVFEIIEKYGFPRGNKKKNNIGIPDWIMSNNKYLKVCIRGIIDTDGSVFPKSRNKSLPQIEVSSQIPNLREDFRNGLIKLGFKPSKWSKGSNTPNCGLYAKNQVFKYFREIGFSNPKHTKKFINITNSNLV